MRRLVWIGMSATTLGAIIVSCIPEFQFRDESEPPVGIVVPCGDDTSVDCAPAQVCCYHTQVASCDMCSNTSDCMGSPFCEDAGTYAVFQCNNKEDCTSAKQCCLTYTRNGLFIVPQGSQCQPACASNQFPLCDIDAGCDDIGLDAGVDANITCHEIGYPGYRACYE